MNGVLPVDKPAGITSHDVVKLSRRALNCDSVGHAGTLDPMATGLLLILVGEGTKLSSFLQSESKTYHARMLLGVVTDTDDITGSVIERNNVNIDPEGIKKIFEEFKGDIYQVPPNYSAIKLSGKPIYKYARAGLFPVLPPRKVFIEQIDIKCIRLPEVEFTVTCSKGTYIRALVRDIGRRIGCGATLNYLRRTRSGDFVVEDALSVDDIKKLSPEEIRSRMVSLNKALLRYPFIVVDDEEAKRVKNAQINFIEKIVKERNFSDEKILKIVKREGQLLAIVSIEDNVKILRVFNE